MLSIDISAKALLAPRLSLLKACQGTMAKDKSWLEVRLSAASAFISSCWQLKHLLHMLNTHGMISHFCVDYTNVYRC